MLSRAYDIEKLPDKLDRGFVGFGQFGSGFPSTVVRYEKRNLHINGLFVVINHLPLKEGTSTRDRAALRLCRRGDMNMNNGKRDTFKAI